MRRRTTRLELGSALAFADAELEALYQETAHRRSLSATEAVRILVLFSALSFLLPVTKFFGIAPLFIAGYIVNVKEFRYATGVRNAFKCMTRLVTAWLCRSGSGGVSVIENLWISSVLPLFINAQFFVPLSFRYETLVQPLATLICSSWILSIAQCEQAVHQVRFIWEWIALFGTAPLGVAFPVSPVDVAAVHMFLHLMCGSVLSCFVTYVHETCNRAKFWNDQRPHALPMPVVEATQSAALQCVHLWLGIFLVLCWTLPCLSSLLTIVIPSSLQVSSSVCISNSIPQ